MKKTIFALALVGFTYGAFAQTTPAKTTTKPATAAAAPAKPAKADTAKHAKTVKKIVKKK